MTTFEQFGLKSTTNAALAKMGYTTPTDVQKAAIPAFLQGRDVLAQARTGTGKTAAFGIPLVEALEGAGPGPRALVLVPTRELALQVAQVLAELAHGTPLRIVAIYGGAGYGNQDRDLRANAPIILVATPGRLLDHMERGTLTLRYVHHLVLDEADRMLDMGFRPDVERVLQRLPQKRQTGLFSATVPEAILHLVRRYQHDPVQVRIESGPAATPMAEHFRLDVQQNHKTELLEHLLTQEKPERAIVFTRTKHRAKRLARDLSHKGWNAVALQGNMTQGQRERAMASFRTGEAQLLVATDVASRGLDIPEVSHVVNFDIPVEAEAYVHRIGRTARNGRNGRAITFVAREDASDLRAIERVGGIRLDAYAWSAGAPTLSATPTPAAARQEGHVTFHGRKPQRSGSFGGPRREMDNHRRANGNPGRRRDERPRRFEPRGGNRQGPGFAPQDGHARDAGPSQADRRYGSGGDRWD